MALKFKKQYANQALVLSDGTLVNAASLSKASVQAKIKGVSSFAYLFEEDTTTDPPVTGGGGAGDPRKPKTTRTRKK
jgi:hypothetical protein